MKVKVLIVDESAVTRKVLLDVLLKAHIHNVGQASDGRSAVIAVARDNYDLVLMAWEMFKMPGVEAVREIRAKGINVPIIMFAGEANKSKVIEALKSGATGYIVKPFTPELIGEKIRNTIEHKKPQDK